MKDFDWVTALSACSVNEIFEKLKSQVKADVEKRHTQLPQQRHYGFRFTANGRDFTALLEGNKLHHSVIFTLEEQAISVRDEKDNAILRAVPTLNHEGQCLLKIDGVEYELWQVRKMALESLFFSEREAPDYFARFGGHKL